MKRYVVDYDKVYTEEELYTFYLSQKQEGEWAATGSFSDFLSFCESDGSIIPADPETMLYDVEGGSFVYIEDLKSEFLCLQEDDPETYDYPFSAYLENCLSATLSRF